MSQIPPVAGFELLSLTDWPGHVAAVVFTIGCNMRCPWCHNPSLVHPDIFPPAMPVAEIEHYLDSLDPGLYDGVVVTGGEPVIHSGLSLLLEMIKKRGLKVRLDTNGSRPDVLEKLLDAGLVDAVAMDYKLPSQLYWVVGWHNPDAILQSLTLLAERRCGYVRTTLVPNLHNERRLNIMKAEFGSVTSGRIGWLFQKYQTPPQRGGTDYGQPAAGDAS